MGAPHVVPGQAGIIDVARRAGVSASTVSRSLRGSSKVSEHTRERVLRAAAELRYVPSPAASRLASGRTRAIGVIVPFATRWFFSEVLTGVVLSVALSDGSSFRGDQVWGNEPTVLR